MEIWVFGVTMTIVGMGGTFVTLGLIILAIEILKRVFPLDQRRKAESA